MPIPAALATLFDTAGRDLEVPAQHTLLHAGEVASKLYLVRAGAVRLCLHSPQGHETSVQFFFEGDVVSALESMLSGQPSALALVTMEACRLRVLDRASVVAQVQRQPTLQTELLQHTQQRLVDYVRLYTAAISRTPAQRYCDMQATHGARLARIPLHILASYLGITPVHLSRIRRKLKAEAPAR